MSDDYKNKQIYTGGTLYIGRRCQDRFKPKSGYQDMFTTVNDEWRAVKKFLLEQLLYEQTKEF